MHDRGVFCAHDLSQGDIIEICPVLILSSGEAMLLRHSDLYNYYWLWGYNHEQIAIVLGFGSLYNHSSQPNAETDAIPDRREIVIRAMTEIRADTEITIDYGGGKRTRPSIWFTVREQD